MVERDADAISMKKTIRIVFMGPPFVEFTGLDKNPVPCIQKNGARSIISARQK